MLPIELHSFSVPASQRDLPGKFIDGCQIGQIDRISCLEDALLSSSWNVGPDSFDLDPSIGQNLPFGASMIPNENVRQSRILHTNLDREYVQNMPC